MCDGLIINRRSFLLKGVAAAASSLVFPTFLRATSNLEKSLTIYNIHTGEWFKGVYVVGNHYIPDAIKDLKKIMRDWRHNTQHDIHPKLYDMMHTLSIQFDTKRPFNLICGFRSSHTNEALRRKNRGVAQKSLHLSGKAVDISLEGVQLSQLRDAARALKVGGVGYYPSSCFIHMDIRDKIAWW